MQAERARDVVGCLLIDDGVPGMACLSGLRPFLDQDGIRCNASSLDGGSRLWEHVQADYYEARRGCDIPAIVARGAACWAALALAEQLPAKRLVLIDGETANPPARPAAQRRQLARIRAFARRNLFLCMSDVLVICTQPEESSRIIRDLRAARGRLVCAQPSCMQGANACISVAGAISSFLRSGEFTKCLAENHEMCIIYG